MAEVQNTASTKVLSLDAIPLIKYDFLEELAEESKLISEAYKKAIDSKAEELWNNFKNASDEDKQVILDQLTELVQKDETLSDDVEALKATIQAISNKIDGLEQPDSVLSEDEVKDIISAALVNESFWTNDTIGAPTLIGNKIISLVGTFGTVKAENIEGTLIEGKTVQSVPDAEGNIAWQLNNTGNGHLANGNISWDAAGKVTLGSDVTIKWDNIDGKPEINEDDLVGVPGADGADGITPLLEIREDYWFVSYDNGVTWTKLNKATGEQGPQGPQGEQGEQGPAGNDGKDGLPGADGKSIVSTTCEYGLSADENTEPEEWIVHVPELIQGQYLWTRTTWTYNEGDPEYGYTKTYIAQDGNDGENGLPGKDGTKIVSTTFEYGLSADENTEPEEWINSVPALIQGMYLWTKMTWTYSDESSETGYTKTYISKDGEQGPEGPAGADGEAGLTPVIHVKYANEVIYNSDGTVNSVEWTTNDGEDIGVYKGMYVDYNADLENESMNANDYSWTMVNPEKAVATQLGAYQITSNTISGKTLQSTKNTELEANTVFETHLEDGTFDKLIESDGTTEGPAWQLRDSGEGYLAQGNIRWDENGDVTFGEGVKIKWDNVDEKPPIPEGGITESEKEEIITTVIDRSGITAETITGRTIQSSEPISEEDTDPTWQINNKGIGYLAKKNIFWDETGKLTANIDGGSLGKQDENGKFPFEWDEDNVYVNKNFVFDEGVGITWDNISGTENIASKDDIPVLDDYATKEYVDQNSGGFTTEIGNNWIKTADVTCQNLKVTKVDTAPTESGDKVTILGNTIQVLNDNDQPGLSISNNNINFKYSPELLKTSSSFQSDDNGTDGYISIQKIYISGSGEVLNGSGGETGPICEIGALNNTSMLSITCAVRLVSGAQVSTSNYSITTANTASRPYIAVYKYNDNTAAWDYAGKIACTSWDKVTSIIGQPVIGGTPSYMYRFAYSDYYFKFDRGIYALGLVLPEQSITFNSNYINKAVQARVDFNVNSIRRNLSSFVDIGKNGIVINSEKGNIYMDNSNIVMSMGTSESMYGIKITPNGMYYANGGSTWTKWNPLILN